MKDSRNLIDEVANPDQVGIGWPVESKRRLHGGRGHTETFLEIMSNAQFLGTGFVSLHGTSAENGALFSERGNQKAGRFREMPIPYRRTADGLERGTFRVTSMLAMCSFKITMSTRRFCALPCDVLLLAIG